MIKIRETRKERNITCDDLARKIGVTKQAISQAEMLHNRMLTPDKAKILSDFFGKPIYYFVDLDDLYPYEMTNDDIDIIMQHLSKKRK